MTLQRIIGFRLVTADLNRLAQFYAAIGFTVGERRPIATDEMTLLGLEGAAERLSLTVGAQRLELDAFDMPGQPYPAANAASLAFQHLALVTDDAGAAWARAEAAGASPISRDGAVKLPASSGGVTAVKFRDPEGHPLEFLQFPPGVETGWRGRGVLGIDHSAISISDTGVSCAFYADHGLREDEGSLNTGAEQEALDGLIDVCVRVTPMNPASKPPHLELLAYARPRPPATPERRPNDIASTRIVWRADRDALIADPDGHLHQLCAAD